MSSIIRNVYISIDIQTVIEEVSETSSGRAIIRLNRLDQFKFTTTKMAFSVIHLTFNLFFTCISYPKPSYVSQNIRNIQTQSNNQVKNGILQSSQTCFTKSFI